MTFQWENYSLKIVCLVLPVGYRSACAPSCNGKSNGLNQLQLAYKDLRQGKCTFAALWHSTLAHWFRTPIFGWNLYFPWWAASLNEDIMDGAISQGKVRCMLEKAELAGILLFPKKGRTAPAATLVQRPSRGSRSPSHKTKLMTQILFWEGFFPPSKHGFIEWYGGVWKRCLWWWWGLSIWFRNAFIF